MALTRSGSFVVLASLLARTDFFRTHLDMATSSTTATPAETSDDTSMLSLPLFSWLKDRSAGVLLHPTCFPGAFGVGSLDTAVDAWLSFLSTAGIRYWQICPLGPTGYGDSPYQCFSAFAGNPYLIDLQALQRHGLLTEADLAPLRALPETHVDFGWLYVTKWPTLFKAFDAFEEQPGLKLPYGDFAAFCDTHAAWLKPFALFQALKDHHHPKPWWEWPEDVLFYSRAAKASLPDSVLRRARAHSFFQYIFFGQWQSVRERARRLNIEIIGDAPIFVARDSADVWADPELFLLDQKTGHPLFVAGVPPDYFSADGQLWGNPLYAWDKHAETKYAWWLQRLRTNFLLCDVLRIDHFRGFDTYWSIPADAATARIGAWESGPGLALFEAIRSALPEARLIAEDLGDLLPSVLRLRDATGLPGMTVLQFAFGGRADNSYLPHNLTRNSVVYPGTHDNDTTLGWYLSAGGKTQDHVRRYFRISGETISWDFLRAAYASVSNLAIIPFQDLLALGSEARFNTPGKAAGNWQWRYQAWQLEKLHLESAGYLHELGELYRRVLPLRR
jgi:4-alpha-glucanotransferase